VSDVGLVYSVSGWIKLNLHCSLVISFSFFFGLLNVKSVVIIVIVNYDNQLHIQ